MVMPVWADMPVWEQDSGCPEGAGCAAEEYSGNEEYLEMRELMSEGWKKNVRKAIPYVPGEQPRMDGMIKLNTNENPYPPAPGVAERLKEMDPGELRLYPDPASTALVGALASRYGCGAENVFVGVGSDDVLGTAFLTFFSGEDPVLFPDITYSFYDVWADLYRIPYRRIPLDEEFRIQAEDYRILAGGLVLANPNAPTGIYEPLSFVEGMLKEHPDCVVLVDEAYVDFAGPSAAGLIGRYDNLLVVQTFSKSRSMAGIRIGFALGNAELIAAMNAVRNSYNSYTMNLPSQELGVAALEDEAYFQETVARIVATRERSRERFEGLGFLCTDSRTNFLFVRHPAVSAEYLMKELRKRRIFVRHFSSPRIQEYLRVTVGSDPQMDSLFMELEEIISQI